MMKAVPGAVVQVSNSAESAVCNLYNLLCNNKEGTK